MKEKTYRVRWEIDIDATSPEVACERALEIQRDHMSTATIFSVIKHKHLQRDMQVVDVSKL